MPTDVGVNKRQIQALGRAGSAPLAPGCSAWGYRNTASCSTRPKSRTASCSWWPTAPPTKWNEQKAVAPDPSKVNHDARRTGRGWRVTSRRSSPSHERKATRGLRKSESAITPTMRATPISTRHRSRRRLRSSRPLGRTANRFTRPDRTRPGRSCVSQEHRRPPAGQARRGGGARMVSAESCTLAADLRRVLQHGIHVERGVAHLLGRSG